MARGRALIAVLLSLLSGLVFAGLLTVFVGTLVVLGLTPPLRSLAPGGRLYWVWDELWRHPWQWRLFSFCYFWVIAVAVEYLVGITEGHWPGALIVAVPVSVLFTWASEPLLRKRP